MAKIVLGIGTSHTPMLNTPLSEWFRFIEKDRERPQVTRDGRPVTFDELARMAPPGLEKHVTPEVLADKHARAMAEVERVSQAVKDARLDALVIVGDDQKELYHDDNIPAILVYRGETIRNVPSRKEYPGLDFMKAAMAPYFERETPREYPVHAGLARHLIGELMEDFDLSSASKVLPDKGEGHAFGFVHNRMGVGDSVPVVPVFLNTYFPPNVPTPSRCYRLGQAIHRAVESFGPDLRVGILASGGLSHFTVDEDLDREVLRALREKDGKALAGIPAQRLQSGSSEIRNWICMAGAIEHLPVQHLEYIPTYRTAAGTGMGLCFGVWK